MMFFQYHKTAKSGANFSFLITSQYTLRAIKKAMRKILKVIFKCVFLKVFPTKFQK